MTEPIDKLEVWTDGDCVVCRSSRQFCEKQDPEGRLRFQDFRVAADADLPLDRAAHETSMWVRDGDGKLMEGFAAWRRIMAELPRWRWLAALSGVAPIRWIGPTLYRLVAKFRFGLRSI
jgi:predicted DCC family thiol-disulfide oxidoreductase YuxK